MLRSVLSRRYRSRLPLRAPNLNERSDSTDTSTVALVSQSRQRAETHPLLHLWPSHPFSPSKGSSERGSKHQSSTLPGQATSTALHLRGPLLVPTLVPSLRLRLYLRLHLRALMVLEDGRGPCSGSHRGSSRWLSVVLASRMATTGGSAQPKRELRRRKRRKRCPRRNGPSSSKRKGGGTRKKDDAGLLQLRSLASYDPPARGQAGITTCVVASPAN